MAFQSIKPHCVAFLQHVRLSEPSNVDALPRILSGLQTELAAVAAPSAPAAPPQLAGYIFFPFSQFLQLNPVALLRSSLRHQEVFKDVLRCLKTLVQVTGLDKGVREQLWTFSVLTLGGPLGSKDIQRAWSDAVQLATLGVLDALLSAEDGKQAAELDIPLPVLAHSLNTVLLLVESPEFDVKLAGLDTLNLLIDNYLAEKDLLPQFLPGVVSTLCKAIVGTRANSSVACKALAALASSIAPALSEDRCCRFGLYEPSEAASPQATSLEELFALAKRRGADMNGGADSADPQKKEFHSSEPGASAAWLRATASQIHRAILSLLAVLRQHDVSGVRKAFGKLSYTILKDCGRSLMPETARTLLEQLLVLSQDDWDEVATAARASLAILLDDTSTAYISRISQIAEDSLTALPHSIFSHGSANEPALQRQLHLIRACFAYTKDISATDLQIEKWSRTFLRALELVPVRHDSRQPDTEASAAWSSGSRPLLLEKTGTTDGSENGIGKNRLAPFPALKFVNIAPGRSVVLLEKALQEIAAASLSSGSTVMLDHFLVLADVSGASDIPHQSLAASSLWVVSQVLAGYAKQADLLKLAKRSRLARDVIHLALSLLEEDDLDLDSGGATVSDTAAASSSMLYDEELQANRMHPVQVRKGLMQLDGLMGSDSKTSSIAPIASKLRTSFRVQIRALSLQLFAETSSILQDSFRSQLLHALYPLLRSLSPSITQTHGLEQAYAYVAIYHVAHYAGYDSPADMLIQNVDYILNSISAALRGGSGFGGSGTADLMAPSVLISVMDMAGEDVLPFLGDAVDEIFEALDRWHGYDLLVSELLRVLNRLVSVVRAEEYLEDPDEKARRELLIPNPDTDRDLEEFADWFRGKEERDSKRKAQPTDSLATEIQDQYPGDNPHKPFEELKVEDDGQEGQEDNDNTSADGDKSEGRPITRPQALVLSILRKCLYFLSHSSPFLRARVLSLLSSCIPILANRGSDLLPEISRFWPYILARLDDASEGVPNYVTLECLQLISVLMHYKGDFMNLRIVKDVWPRLKRVVAVLHAPHNARALLDQFSTPHRLLRSCMECTTTAVISVSGIKNEDLWDIALAFRSSLANKQHPDLRFHAIKLYTGLGQADADLAWTVLAGSAGRMTAMEALDMPELYNCAAVEQLLAVL